MQWDASPNAGFTTEGVTPWLPLAGNYPEHNVVSQEKDPTSMLNLYRALAQLRQNEPALCVGDYKSVETGVEQVFAYLRTASNTRQFLVVLNFSKRSCTLDLSHIAPTAIIAVATDMIRHGEINLSNLSLNPDEGLVLKL
jgi:alpha-glucosidase